MASDTIMAGKGNRWRVMGWGIAAGILLLPFIAMQFTREANWTGSDFIFAAVLIALIWLASAVMFRRADPDSSFPRKREPSKTHNFICPEVPRHPPFWQSVAHHLGRANHVVTNSVSPGVRRGMRWTIRT